MQNPFLKPHTAPRWLLSSICWVGSCLGLFQGSIWGASALSASGPLIAFVVFGSAIAVCVLMWQRVISVGWRIIGQDNKSLTVSIVDNLAVVWLALLSLAFCVSVLLIAFGLLICFALAGEPQGGGWQ